jgi:chemotaxis family two-component system sensor kinase Cph1
MMVVRNKDYSIENLHIILRTNRILYLHSNAWLFQTMDEDLERTSLRAMAEKRLEEQPRQAGTAGDYVKLIAELTIHQEELNIQNEELKRLQLELEETRTKYFELFDLAPLGYITLTPQLIVKEANLEASKILECDRGMLINRGISSFVSPGSLESLYLHYRRVAEGQVRKAEIITIQRKNGTEVKIQFESNLVGNRPEKGIRSILTDVTKLKNTEEALKRSNNELELVVQARLKDLEKSNIELQHFAYVASHDLQEPLRMVISHLALLDKRYKDALDPEAREHLHFAVDGGMMMKALIDDLLTYSRIDSQVNALTPVNMNGVVAKTLTNLAFAIKETQAQVIVGEMPIIIADESQMFQVMLNLIGNSLKFRGPEPPVIRITAEEQGNDWIFYVKDNGIGIKEDYAERIFVMFQRLHTKAEYPGTGIGLAIVKKVVEHHDGRIWVESEEGKGATFFFTIPKK